MMLGDILAEHFRLKAVHIRMKLGLAVLCCWLLNALFVLAARIIFGVYILYAVNAPKWIWLIWILGVPSGFLVEQIDQKAK
jgi:hypothetical protein